MCYIVNAINAPARNLHQHAHVPSDIRQRSQVLLLQPLWQQTRRANNNQQQSNGTLSARAQTYTAINLILEEQRRPQHVQAAIEHDCNSIAEHLSLAHAMRRDHHTRIRLLAIGLQKRPASKQASLNKNSVSTHQI
jgi:hypothetical protein